jgi:nitrite reductase (NADH) small subunit
MAAAMVWHRICTIDDIPPLGSRTVTTAGDDIAVFRLSDDRVLALYDRCPHQAGRLSQGIVHGESVTCPLHGWVIGLPDGQARSPDEGCARGVAVRVDGRAVYLGLNGS